MFGNFFIYTENKEAPDVEVLDQLLVHHLDVAHITSDIIRITDLDTPSNLLTFHLVSSSSMGEVLVMDKKGQERVLESGQSLNMELMKHGRVRFIHVDENVNRGRTLQKTVCLLEHDGH